MIEIEKCTSEEFKSIRENHELEISWLDDCENDKVLYEGEVIAILHTNENEEDKAFELISFEVLKKGSGYGKMIVEMLKTKHDYIKLYQDNESDEFWRKMGFEYRDDGLGTVEMFYHR